MSKVRPFRFGVAAESAPSREQWITLVRKSEDLGYATFLLADHFVNEFLHISCRGRRTYGDVCAGGRSSGRDVKHME